MMDLAAIGNSAFDAFGNPDEHADIETHSQIVPRELGIQLIRAEGVKGPVSKFEIHILNYGPGCKTYLFVRPKRDKPD